MLLLSFGISTAMADTDPNEECFKTQSDFHALLINSSAVMLDEHKPSQPAHHYGLGAMLAAQVGDLDACLVHLQNPDDLLFRKAAALHALVLGVGQNEVQTGLSPWGKVRTNATRRPSPEETI